VNSNLNAGFLKPIQTPHIKNSSIKELLLLVKELGNQRHINLIFIFSEKEALVTKLLVKYKILSEITRFSDPAMIYFDMFQIKNLYQKCCEFNERNTHIFGCNGEEVVNHIEYGVEIP
jgi:hypothetical protein